MAVRTRKFIVKVDENWCKGCEICVAFCPKNVLAMEKGKAKVDNPDACTGCQLCEIYCPDFAITVNRTEDSAS
jgi:2-oxoglutarate ferredoxin oxidoreductase subunit delta